MCAWCWSRFRMSKGYCMGRRNEIMCMGWTC